jgi:hypothetical protein
MQTEEILSVLPTPNPQSGKLSDNLEATTRFQNCLLDLVTTYQNIHLATRQVGYLQAELERSDEKLKKLPELQQRVAQLRSLEAESENLKHALPMVLSLAARADELDSQNEVLREEVLQLERSGASFLEKLIGWLLGEHSSPGTRSRFHTGEDYYDRIRSACNGTVQKEQL